MSFKETYEKEKYVVVNGQSAKFRIVKYSIIIPLLVGLYLWKGARFSGYLVLFLVVFGTITHFVLRWKTKGWTQKWWFVDPIIKK